MILRERVRKNQEGFHEGMTCDDEHGFKRWRWNGERILDCRNNVSTHGGRKAHDIFGEWGITGCV